MTIVQLYSEAFLDEEFKNKLAVRPSMDVWERIMNTHTQFQRIFLRIHHPSLSDQTFLIAMGDPVAVTSDLSNSLFLPAWMIDTNMYGGCGEEAFIDIVSEADLMKASKIVIRPIDSMILDLNIVEQLQPALSALGCLQGNTQYNIPLEAMGGYPVPIYISNLEPANEVFLDGDEIPLELEEAVDSVSRVPTPIPPIVPQLAALQFEDQGAVSVPNEVQSSMIPASEIPQPTNRTLRRSNLSTVSAFVPFSGEGRRLGGS